MLFTENKKYISKQTSYVLWYDEVTQFSILTLIGDFLWWITDKKICDHKCDYFDNMKFHINN